MKHVSTIVFLCVLAVRAVSAPPACTASFNITGTVLQTNDTVYACAGVPLTFDDVSLLEGVLTTRNWDFGDGNQELGALLSSQTTHTYSTEGTYTASLTIGSVLCVEVTVPRTVIVLGSPQYLVMADQIACHGDCNGSITLNIQSVNADLYNVVWNGLGSSTNTVSGLCAGEYDAVIEDPYGCASDTILPVTLADPQLLVGQVAVADTLDLCPSDGTVDIPLGITGGNGDYQALWDVSSAISPVSATLMQFTPTEQSLDQMYHVEVIDGNGCSSVDSVYIRSTPSVLQGSVAIEGSPCVNCEVIQLRFDAAPGLWQPLGTTVTDVDGNYSFGLIENFIPFTIMADPDPDNHPLAAPGFYPQGHKWSTATVLQNVCGSVLNKHIDLLNPLNMNGTNTLSGTVWYDPTGKTQTEEDPIPLIDVVVEKTPPGQAQARVETGQDGGYSFDFVPNSDTIYTLFVSMPGIPVSTTYEILAVNGDEDYCNLDFCLNIDSTEINICNGSANPCVANVVTGNGAEGSENGLVVYPNPNRGRFVIETGMFAQQRSTVQIMDATGRLIFDRTYAITPYTVNMVNMADGYYIVQLLSANAVESTSVVVSKH